MVRYDKVIVAVFTANKQDLRMYFNLFKLMLEGKITKAYISDNMYRIETDKFILRFYIKNMNIKGIRSHFVLNLTQDDEFDKYIVTPMQYIRTYLKDDEKWKELFE
jgi:hypothetical protein